MSSNCVHDQYRRRQAGNGVTIPTNSKPATDMFHVERSQLGVHQEWDETAPNEWGGKGKMVPVTNDIQRNALAAMGDLRAKSSNRQPDAPSDDTGSGPCCVPMGYPPYGRNPIYRKREK